jgi:hypothetical protein
MQKLELAQSADWIYAEAKLPKSAIEHHEKSINCSLRGVENKCQTADCAF